MHALTLNKDSKVATTRSATAVARPCPVLRARQIRRSAAAADAPQHQTVLDLIHKTRAWEVRPTAPRARPTPPAGVRVPSGARPSRRHPAG